MFRYIVQYVFTNQKTRLILILTVAVSLCITLIGTYSYSKYREVLDTELNTPNVELLQINVDVTNRAFQESDTKALDAAFHPYVLDFLRNPPTPEQQPEQVLTDYLASLANHPDIRSIAVIGFPSGVALSSKDGYALTWDDAADHTWSGWIQELETKPLLVKRRMQGGEGPAGRVELLSLARPVVLEGAVRGAVLVNMDYDRFFSKIYTHLSSHQYVHDLDGELIYPKLNIPVPLSEMDKVMASIDVNPFAYVKVAGQDYMANQAFSNVTGWRMISLVPMEELLKNVRMARNMMLLLSLISIVVGCSAMYYYNYAAFRPLKRINKILSPLQKSVAQGDLHSLEPVIGKLLRDLSKQSVLAEQSLPELRSKFLQDVLGQTMGSQEILIKWSQYFPDWQPGGLEVLAVSVDQYGKWVTGYAEEDRMLLKYALNNILLEVLAEHWRAVSLPVGKDGYALLLQAKEQGAASLHEEAARLIRVVGEYLSISVSVATGSPAAGILEVAGTYGEAREALLLRLYEGYGQVRDYQTTDPGNDEEESFAAESWKREVLNAVNAGDKETAVQWVRKGMGEARRHRIQPERVYKAVEELAEELMKLLAASGSKAQTAAGVTNYSGQGLSTTRLEDIEAMLTGMAGELAEERDRRKETKEHQLVQAMIRFMEENLHKSIGLQDVADHIHMGISSVSTIFKEETGSTVYDYLTALRIEKACGLLRETPLKIADIATQVGYQNENSFIRAFRKSKSITPGKYRETSKYANGYADPPKPRHSGVFEDLPEE
jgi:two-component system, response regulator YesN